MTIKRISFFLLSQNIDKFFQGESSISPQQIEALIKQRKQARVDKDFALSDKIRADLLVQGIVLEDAASGTTWRKE